MRLPAFQHCTTYAECIEVAKVLMPPGTEVRIACEAEDDELNWQNGWDSEGMTYLVGQTAIMPSSLTYYASMTGIILTTPADIDTDAYEQVVEDYYWPVFVLEPVAPIITASPKKRRI